MKTLPPHRFAAIMTLGCALLPGPGFALRSQDDLSPTAILLSRARTLEQRGRLDLAKQDWTQVLVVDPNDAEALAGMVRAARTEGRTADAASFLKRLKAAHPKDPRIAQLEGNAVAQSTAAELAEAERLARAGDARAAMALYRKVYGLTPPAGAPALAYYGTEAQLEDSRPHAIAGLRALTDRYPADARYSIALGRLLLGSPRTRAEGRTILEGFPGNAEAVAALRGLPGPEQHGGAVDVAAAAATGKLRREDAPALVAGAASSSKPVLPRTIAPGARAGATTSEPSSAVAKPPAPAPASAAVSEPVSRPEPRRAEAVRTAAQGGTHHLASAVAEQAAFSALNAHRLAEAEQRFREILVKDPGNPRALAGLGYLRATVGDFGSAVPFLQQAQENGDRSLALTRAMVNAQFSLALQQAAAARARGDLHTAEERYRAALRERPSDPGALQGLGDTLLQQWRPADAIPVYSKLAQVRPLDPAAWRGLVVAQVSAGHANAALATDARVPADAHSPLQRDSGYERALASARDAGGVEVARVSTPAVPRVAPKIPTPAPAPPPPPQPVEAATPAAPRPAASPERAAPVTARTPASPPSEAHAPRPSGKPLPAPAVAASAPVPAPPLSPALPASASMVHAQPSSGAAFGERLQQANLALLHGKDAEAIVLFRELANHSPERADSWRGLVLALHSAGRESEAASVLIRLPAEAHPILDRDASFQTAAGEVYLAANQPSEALRSFARAQEVFSSQRLPPPLELVLQTARLLAARGDDDNLYRELMYLGDRRDLSDTQRTQVQLIWTRWAVRRARVLAAEGDDRRAVTLLNAAAEAFAGNAEVLRLVAAGYAGVGKAREAVALYRTQDFSTLPATDIEAAIAAAIAARDRRTAEGWLRVGLDRFGRDPEMLTTAAELEQARGHEKRAVELTQQAKSLAPAQNPGQVLTAELKEAKAGAGWGTRPGGTGQLGTLLAPHEAAALGNSTSPGKPYLPAAGENARGAMAGIASSDAPVLTGYDEPSR